MRLRSIHTAKQAGNAPMTSPFTDTAQTKRAPLFFIKALVLER